MSFVGKRKINEDAVLCSSLGRGVVVYGVFDGHGGVAGQKAASLAAGKLPEYISAFWSISSKDDAFRIKIVFKVFDVMLSKTKSWFFASNSTFLEAGTCACVAIVAPNRIIVANVGDCRAVFCDGERITRDHRCDDPVELARIKLAGGVVFNGRVNGLLEPTRALGDFALKQGKKNATLISSEPDVFVLPVDESTPKVIFLVSDGVTCAVSDQDLADLYSKNVSASYTELAQLVVQMATERGSRDNISCVVCRTRIPVV